MDAEQKALGRCHLIALVLVVAFAAGGWYTDARGHTSVAAYLLLSAVVVVVANWAWTFRRTVRYLWNRFLK